MPPKAKPRPPEKDVQALAGVDCVAGVAQGRAVRSPAQPRRVREHRPRPARHRRRSEGAAARSMPSANGFDNVGEALHISSFLMETYLEAADTALERRHRQRAAAAADQEALLSLKDEHGVKVDDRERLPHPGRRTWSCSVRRPGTRSRSASSTRRTAATIASASPPPAIQSAGKPVTFRVDAGPMLMGTKNHLVGYFDAPADKPTVVRVRRSLRAAEPHPHPPLRPGERADGSQDRGRQVRRGRAWRSSGSRSKGRCTTPGRRRAIAASSATCRRRRRRSTTTATASRSSRRTPRPTPSASSATSPAAPFAAR